MRVCLNYARFLRIANEPPEPQNCASHVSVLRQRQKRLLRRIGTAKDGAERAADGRARAKRRHSRPL
jgi:hypothetical protein